MAAVEMVIADTITLLARGQRLARGEALVVAAVAEAAAAVDVVVAEVALLLLMTRGQELAAQRVVFWDPTPTWGPGARVRWRSCKRPGWCRSFAGGVWRERRRV